MSATAAAGDERWVARPEMSRSERDLVTALPRGLAELHAARFGIKSVDAPFPLRKDEIRVVATRSALTDAGVAWLFETIQRATTPLTKTRSLTR